MIVHSNRFMIVKITVVFLIMKLRPYKISEYFVIITFNTRISSLKNNINYNLFHSKLTNAIHNNTTKYVKYNKFKHNPWMTAGILKSIKFCYELHLKSKKCTHIK